jgi:hypothetical protein
LCSCGTGNNLHDNVNDDVSPQEAALSPGTDRSTLSPLRIVAALCVIAPIVTMLWVPSYNRMDPRLLGFPFFYWYQLLWVVITAVLMFVAFQAVKRDEAARRAERQEGSK